MTVATVAGGLENKHEVVIFENRGKSRALYKCEPLKFRHRTGLGIKPHVVDGKSPENHPLACPFTS